MYVYMYVYMCACMVLWREGAKEALLPTSTEKTRLPFQLFSTSVLVLNRSRW